MADAQHYLLTSPPGVVHLLPNVKRTLIDFCRDHKLKDKKYLMVHLAGKSEETYGWQLVEKHKYLQHVATGKMVVVVGKPKHLFDARAAACERAGLDSNAMPFDKTSAGLKKFERLLDENFTSMEEAHGWRLVRKPQQISAAECSTPCAVCGLMTVDLFKLINSKRERVEPTVALDRFGSWCPSVVRRDAATNTLISGVVAANESSHFDPICELDRARFQPMSEFDFARTALLDKFFGAREAALLTIGEAMRSSKLSDSSLGVLTDEEEDDE